MHRPAVALREGEAVILSTMSLSAGGEASALAEAQLRQIGPARDAHHVGRQLASLLLGWQPDAEGIVVVVTRPAFPRARLALGLGGMLVAGALLALARAWRTPARAEDAGLAVLLSGDARPADAPPAAGLKRLEGIATGQPVTTSGPASFGFSSPDASAGMDSLRVYASGGARLEFLEILPGGEAAGAPVVVAPQEGRVLFVRSGEGRAVCLAGVAERLCSCTTLAPAALGGDCDGAGCEWSCLLGACRLERRDDSTELVAPSRLAPAASVPVPLSLADLRAWDDVCGGCLEPR